MLEAGRNYVPEHETPMFQTSDQAPLRGASTPEKAFGFYDATIDGGWTVPGEPYVQSSSDPHGRFAWWRSRMLGGRTNHWGRISLRNGPYDFKPHSRDGLGFDWPIILRGCGALLRQSRAAHRRVRYLRGAREHAEFLSRMPPAAAGALGQRLPGAAARRAPGDSRRPGAPRGSHAAARFQALAGVAASRQSEGAKDTRNAHAAALGLHLGHRLRPRLLDPGELSVDHRASAAGARDREPRHRVQRHGQPGGAGKKRPRQGREIRRQGQRRGAPGERARDRARGQRLRDRAYSAQLQERAVPGWPCQFQRQGRALHHGHRGRPI